MADAETTEAVSPPPLPDGEYAIAEIMGHLTLIGRVTEVERFGTKLMSIEPILNGKLLDPVLVGGSSIYQFTPCSKERAAERAPTEEYYLPASIRAALPPTALPAPTIDELADNIEAFVATCKCVSPVVDAACPVHGDEIPF